MGHIDGVVKFHSHWDLTPPLPLDDVQELLRTRQQLYRRGLIGVDRHGVGYGNLSRREGPGTAFIVSGSGTGVHPDARPEHFTSVTRFDLEKNELACRGPIQASSESLSHAALYAQDPGIGAVIHIHDAMLWEAGYNRWPTTPRDAPYGTPAMAWAIQDLLRQADLPRQQILVMGGHHPGLLIFGDTLADALRLTLQHYPDGVTAHPAERPLRPSLLAHPA